MKTSSSQYEKGPRLVVPPRIYGVSGCETSIYYRNLTSVINPANYAFEVECEKGRMDEERWRWTPSCDECGTFPIRISMWSDQGLEAEARTEIVVSPADAGTGGKCAFLYVGASCTVAKGHPEALQERFLRPGNPVVTMLGSQAPGYGKPQPGGPAVEAYGGWSWSSFFLRDRVEFIENADGLHPRRPYDVPSPFLFRKNGETRFDFPQYIETVCHGVIPDCILFELGVNGVFQCRSDAECEKLLSERIALYMRKMLTAFKEVAPDACYGVELIPVGSWSQDGFGANYGCQQSRRRWLLNAEMMNLFYLAHAEEWGYECVPAYLNVDGSSNYPTKMEPRFAGSDEMVARVCNALHPAQFGQWADMEYYWMKNYWASRLKG